jgi:hypothetical protein
MSEISFLKRRWKMLLNIATLTALALLIFFLRDDLVNTFKNLAHVNAWVLVLLLPIEILNYHAQARMYQGLFGLVGNRLKYRFLFETSLELNFVNNVFPSGGVTGISYFGMRMRSDHITAGKATIVQMIKLILVFLSFEVLLIVGLLFMAIGGRVSDLTILVASSISTLMVIGTFMFMFIIGSKPRINATFAFVTRILNRLIHTVRPKHPETINMERVRYVVDELHANYRLIQSNYRQLKKPFIYALLVNLTEVFAVYAVYVAFGHWVNLGAVILAYAVANFAGIISVLPGGVGVYEALMTGVLAIAGVPVSLSLPVVVMYRILNTIIQLPPGYYFYNRTLHQGPRKLEHA